MDVDKVVEFILRENIKAFIVDPVIKSHQLDENNNGDMDFVLDQFKYIARVTDCAIDLLHHTPKLAHGTKNEEVAGDTLALARGGGSFVAALRNSRTLLAMDKWEAEERNIQESERRSYVRVDQGKTNVSKGGGKEHWYKIEEVILSNKQTGPYLSLVQGLDPSSLVQSIPDHELAQFKNAINVGYGDPEKYEFYEIGTKRKDADVYALAKTILSVVDSTQKAVMVVQKLVETDLLLVDRHNGKSLVRIGTKA